MAIYLGGTLVLMVIFALVSRLSATFLELRDIRSSKEKLVFFPASMRELGGS
jgi:hypothetical protein